MVRIVEGACLLASFDDPCLYYLLDCLLLLQAEACFRRPAQRYYYINLKKSSSPTVVSDRLLVRSSSHEVVQALEADPRAFVSDLSGGLLSIGLSPPPAVLPLLAPRLPPAEEPLRPHTASSVSTPDAPVDLLSDCASDLPDSYDLLEATSAERIVQQAAVSEWQRLNCQQHHRIKAA